MSKAREGDEEILVGMGASLRLRVRFERERMKGGHVKNVWMCQTVFLISNSSLVLVKKVRKGSESKLERERGNKQGQECEKG